MEVVKYIVKARDNSGHEFIKTFLHPVSQPRKTLVPPEGIAVLQQMTVQYEDEVLSAAPFCCVGCGRAASSLVHMPTAHTMGADPVVFDIPLPYCGSSACGDVGMARAKAASKCLGHGTQHNRFAGSERGPPVYKNLNHLAQVEITACVICGDSVNLKKCSRCRIIPYCSPYCQKVRARLQKGTVTQQPKLLHFTL